MSDSEPKLHSFRSEKAENKNVIFFHKYCSENNPDKRLTIAREYLDKDAGDIWIYLYSGLNQELQNNTDNRESQVEIVTDFVAREHASGEVAPYLTELVKYAELSGNQSGFKQALEQGLLPVDEKFNQLLITEMKKSSDEQWFGFEKSLDVAPDQDLMSWFRSMIDEGNLLLYYPPEGQKNALSAHMAYSNQTNQLIISPGMIPNKMTGAMFEMSLVHERGHYYLNQSGENLDSLGDGKLVLNEFFAMMEEYRFYETEDPSFKRSVRNREKYEIQLESENDVVGNVLPNSNVHPRFNFGRVSQIIYEAYNHALIQLSQSERANFISNMVNNGKTKDEIGIELDKLRNSKNSGMLNFEEMEWKREND